MKKPINHLSSLHFVGFLTLLLFFTVGCGTTQQVRRKPLPQRSWVRSIEKKEGIGLPHLGHGMLRSKNVFKDLNSPPLKWTLLVGENHIRLPNGDTIAVQLKEEVIHSLPSDRMESPRGTVLRSAYEPLRQTFLETIGERGGPQKRPLFIIADSRISAELVAALSATGRMAGFGVPIWVTMDPDDRSAGIVFRGPHPCPPTPPPILPPPLPGAGGREHHRMAIGQASLVGQCQAENLEPVFGQWTEALDHCYAKAVLDYPELMGEQENARVSILLTPSGTVAGTTLEGYWSNTVPELSRCIQKTLRIRQYPVNEGFCLLSRDLQFYFAQESDVHHGAPPPLPDKTTSRITWARIHLFSDGARVELGAKSPTTSCTKGSPAFASLRIHESDAIVRWIDTLMGTGQHDLAVLHIRAEPDIPLNRILSLANSLVRSDGGTLLRISVVQPTQP